MGKQTREKRAEKSRVKNKKTFFVKILVKIVLFCYNSNMHSEGSSQRRRKRCINYFVIPTVNFGLRKLKN